MSTERSAVEQSNVSETQRRDVSNASDVHREDVPAPQPQSSYPPLTALAAAVAALYFGRDVFIPLAMAVRLTFALAPVVSGLRKLRVPRPVAVVAVALSAFTAIVLFGVVVASQLGNLGGNLPLYQSNIETKMQSIKDARFGQGIYDRVSKLLDRLGRQKTKRRRRPQDSQSPPLNLRHHLRFRCKSSSRSPSRCRFWKPLLVRLSNPWQQAPLSWSLSSSCCCDERISETVSFAWWVQATCIGRPWRFRMQASGLGSIC